MDRRKAMKITAGVIAGGGTGLFALSKALKAENPPLPVPQKLEFTPAENKWQYTPLDPSVSAKLAYRAYSEGSCMYATVASVISQLAEKFGEPYASFPTSMFKYGHGGIGGYGSVCGTLNGAAALLGLLIPDKKVQDKMITDIFQWYEKESLPVFSPHEASLDFKPPASVSNSVLCHASNTTWCKESGFKVSSNERKERCRRLTADVAQKVTTVLNEIYTHTYMTGVHSNETVNTCVTCHGNDGKLDNTAVKMSCSSCHSESVAHQVFSDVHYKLME
ncbi:MAG: C-GCAxxG-C-C family protein [Prolixibacteraceae bacterium]